MDTKLKNYSYSFPVKAAAFVLAVVFAALSASAVLELPALLNEPYLEDALALDVAADKIDAETFTRHAAFSRLLDSDLDAAKRLATDYGGINDEYVASGKAWEDYSNRLTNESQQALEEKKSGIIYNHLMDYYNSDVYYNSQVSETDNYGEEIEVRPSRPEEEDIRRITPEQAKGILSTEGYQRLVADISSAEQESKQKLQETLSNKKATFNSEYNDLKQRLLSVKNVKIAVYSPSNGALVTNDTSINAQSDLATVFSQMPNYAYVKNTGASAGNVAYAFAHRMESIKADENIALYIGFDTDNFSAADRYSETLAQMQEKVPPIRSKFINVVVRLCLFALALLLLTLYLILTAGRKGKKSEPYELLPDRCWHDVHFYLSGILIALTAFLFVVVNFGFDSYYSVGDLNELKALSAPFAAACAFIYAVFLEWLLSFSRAIKTKTLFSHSLWIVICKRLWRLIKRPFEKLGEMRFTNFKKTGISRAVLYFILIPICCFFIAIFAGEAGFNIVSLGFFALMMLIIAISFALEMRRLGALDKVFNFVMQARHGALRQKMNVTDMPKPVKTLAEGVDEIQNGLQIALDNAISGERLKTQLITNVSHDLKTPLTSIINYTDLLSRCDIDDETAKEYIGVLAEKSARLKTLIEDLVEASKASTGNIKFNLTHLDLYELALQVVGENEDLLSERGIEIRFSESQNRPVVVADSQKTWRIIDNLISNVRKYSLSGSRAYVSVERQGLWGVFTIKNISAQALDISPNELTQRFVRGDASRSTEGSGLGLSIADSLCEGQGGKLALSIDGDMFKASVYLPIAPENKPEGKYEDRTEGKLGDESEAKPAQTNLSPD